MGDVNNIGMTFVNGSISINHNILNQNLQKLVKMIATTRQESLQSVKAIHISSNFDGRDNIL